MKKPTISNEIQNHLIQTIKTVILALVLTLGVSYVFAWTGPTATPPAGNTPTPVNIGTTNQIKDGGLGLDALSVYVEGYMNKLKIGTTGDTGTWKLYTNGDTYSSGKVRADGGLYVGDDEYFYRDVEDRIKTDDSLYTSGVLSTDGAITVDGSTVIDDGAGWHRSYGSTGWLNNTYGGGWYMQDTTWLRAYGNKYIYTSGVMRADTDMRSAKYCDINGANCKTTAQMGGTTVTDTNANTICSGTYTYLNGDGACRDVRTDGDINDTNTDNQTLSVSGNTLSIVRGNSVTLPSSVGTFSCTTRYNCLAGETCIVVWVNMGSYIDARQCIGEVSAPRTCCKVN